MARKKQAAIEAEQPVQSPVIPTEDAIAEERQRINDEQVSDFLGEEVKDGKIVQEPKEEKKPEPELKAEDIEKEIEIDPEVMKREIADSIRKETAKEITDKLTAALGTKPTEEQKDKYEEYSEKFAKEKGRNPSWFELVPFIKDEVKAELKREQEETFKLTTEQNKKITEANTQKQKAFDSYVDEQLNELHVSGKIDKNNEQQRKALFKTMLEVNEGRVKEGKPPIYSVKEIYYEHYKAPTAQLPGADAPVSAGRGNSQVDSGEEYSYQDINKRGFLDILTGRK